MSAPIQWPSTKWFLYVFFTLVAAMGLLLGLVAFFGAFRIPPPAPKGTHQMRCGTGIIPLLFMGLLIGIPSGIALYNCIRYLVKNFRLNQDTTV
ncbi:hypothetical protein [Chitinophaga sp. Cy-1792]|uniref:hypothetical protein n=1 Tax=Chitinophaga sp. Cy-1792 TaxID=2608339 RepID=UPI001423E867|nr:hypothetical protein [Chitinophaga sp. Cy-1792]NIG54911.1 hypothetical protein [Chitinophaga sp. Cy-1792]